MPMFLRAQARFMSSCDNKPKDAGTKPTDDSPNPVPPTDGSPNQELLRKIAILIEVAITEHQETQRLPTFLFAVE